jgi:uncharacterized membrane protein
MPEAKNNQAAAILSYLLVGIIWYFADEEMKKDSFVKFHVKQGLVLLIFAVLWSIALNILFGVLFAGFLFGLFWVLSILYWVPLVLGIIGIVNAVNSTTKELPIIGKFAKKFTF